MTINLLAVFERGVEHSFSFLHFFGHLVAPYFKDAHGCSNPFPQFESLWLAFSACACYEDNFASGVGVEVLCLLAPSPDRAGQVSVHCLPATV